jgi:hypothetical protein
MHQGEVLVALGTVDGDPAVQIEMHIFVDSKASWDHIGGNEALYAEGTPITRRERRGEQKATPRTTE